MLNRYACWRCRKEANGSRFIFNSVDFCLDGRQTWACVRLAEKHGINSDAHMIDYKERPPEGCPKMLEHAVYEAAEKKDA